MKAVFAAILSCVLLAGCWASVSELIKSSNATPFPGRVAIYDEYSRSSDRCDLQAYEVCYEVEGARFIDRAFGNIVAVWERNSTDPEKAAQVYRPNRLLSMGGSFFLGEANYKHDLGAYVLGLVQFSGNEIRVWVPQCRDGDYTGASRTIVVRTGKKGDCAVNNLEHALSAMEEFRGYVVDVKLPPHTIYRFSREGSLGNL